MRLQITMCAEHLPTGIPLNYNHSIASAIYQVLHTSSSDYSTNLHDRGFEFGGKRFKLFTFSQLRVSQRSVNNGELVIRSNPITLYVSSPKEEFSKHLIDGMLKRPEIQFGDQHLRIVEIRETPEPDFNATQHFVCLSPITVSTHTDNPNLNSLQYCRINGDFYKKVVDNLKRKYTLLTGNEAESLNLKLEFNQRYINERGGRISKLIDYKGTKIFGYLAPFRAIGSPELMRVGYQCGFGDGNSKGLGMVEVD